MGWLLYGHVCMTGKDYITFEWGLHPQFKYFAYSYSMTTFLLLLVVLVLCRYLLLVSMLNKSRTLTIHHKLR